MRLKFATGSLFARLTLILIVGLLAVQLITLVLHMQEREHWMGMAAAHGHSAGAGGLPSRFLWHLGLTLLTVIGLALLAVRWVTRPLQRLADAANALAHDLDAPALDTRGPAEVRRAAEAFNFMQQRLRDHVNARSRALAAVSHDLRTPLTRLRLRAELIEDPQLQARQLADIDTMRAMVDSVLSYLRGMDDDEPRQPIDMPALLHSLVADEQELGRPVFLAFEPEVSASKAFVAPPCLGGLASLRRAIGNLIDNAVIHGGSATLRLEHVAGVWRVSVEDCGPGIPASDLSRVTEPFVRLDPSRSLATGGVGLGLAIVRDVARRHGGELSLSNRPEGGLCATLLLPDQHPQTIPMP
jgi:signal transduction histidine kinase